MPKTRTGVSSVAARYLNERSSNCSSCVEYSCEACEKTYHKRPRLHRHYFIEHTTGGFQCRGEQCYSRFETLDERKKHEVGVYNGVLRLLTKILKGHTVLNLMCIRPGIQFVDSVGISLLADHFVKAVRNGVLKSADNLCVWLVEAITSRTTSYRYNWNFLQ